MGATEFDLAGEIIKWLFLVLIVLLIYSALTFASFPESAGIRLIVAIVGGALATFLLTTQELMTAVQSYSAMGIALVVFFPILVLAFFTLVVATKANPIGILLQRILWLIFSVYLFLKAGILFALSRGPDTLFYDTASALSSTKALTSIQASTIDKPMLILLMVVAVAVFAIAVVSNKFVVHWLAKEKISGEVESEKSMLERSHAYDVERAKMMERGGNK
jgi:hypothetical protein